MTPIDYCVIAVYFAVVIGIGFWCRRLAAKNLDNYFLVRLKNSAEH